jgi:serine/threonine protein kinase
LKNGMADVPSQLPSRCEICAEVHVPGPCRTMIHREGIRPGIVPSEGDADPMLGREVGGYELTRVLGSGSFATVYCAEPRVAGDDVALKLMHAHLASDPEMVRRFVGEARAMTLVRHDNVVQVLDINVIEGTRYYIVLELLEGETLEARCERGPIPLDEAIPLLRQVCDGLSAAHVVGVIHRDLKPENILVVGESAAPKVKVMDFGVARRQHLSTGEKRTATGLVMGTPQFLSPEQSQGHAVDARSDIYSVGVIMYRMLTGKLPFTGKNVVEVILAHRSGRATKPSDVMPSLGEAVDRVVLKALEKDPGQRYQTMEEFENALATLAQQQQGPELEPQSAPLSVLLILERLEAAAADDHYELLGVREGSDLAGIRSALGQLVDWFDEARLTGGEELQPRVQAAGARLAAAEEILVTPRSRALYDAERGNFMGVARAINSGLDPRELRALREEFVLRHPEVAIPRKMPGSDGETAPDPEEAESWLGTLLIEDPLNLDLHRQYWALRKRSKGLAGAATTKG